MTNTRFLLGSLAIALLAAGCGGGEEAAPEARPAKAVERSSAGLPAGNVAAGEKLAATKLASGQACLDCHGPNGASPIDASYPVLSGQYEDYIAHALQMYRDGRRNNALMVGVSKDLTDQQIADLAAYFASRDRSLYDLSERTSQ